MRTRRAAVVAAVVVAGSAFVAGAFAPSARAGWWDAAAEARETTLDAIGEAPERWLGVSASLILRYAGPADLPAGANRATPLAEGSWRAFAVDPSPKRGAVFAVRVGSAEEARLATLRPGDQIRVRAAVRHVEGGSAVLEAFWISSAGDALSPEEAATLKRAEDLIAKDNGAAAEPILRSLLESRDLAPPLRAGLWRRIARAQRIQSKREDSAASLRRVLALEPGDVASARELRQLDLVAEQDAARSAAAADASARLLRPFPTYGLSDLPAPQLRLSLPRDRDVIAQKPATQEAAKPPAAASTKTLDPAKSPATPQRVSSPPPLDPATAKPRLPSATPPTPPVPATPATDSPAPPPVRLTEPK